MICTKERTSVRQRLLFKKERIALSDRESVYIYTYTHIIYIYIYIYIYTGAVHCKLGVQIRETVETMLVSVVPVDFEYFCIKRRWCEGGNGVLLIVGVMLSEGKMRTTATTTERHGFWSLMMR